ncbi:MAG: hypothetical protein LCI00_11460 [Chloroflexi bacterium]|nr:hypothetical protein [Chloroflexota bacterium]
MIQSNWIESHIEQCVCKLLDLDGLYGGIHQEKLPTGGVITKFDVKYLWIATIRGYWWSDVTLGITEIRYKHPEKHTSHLGFLIVSGFEKDSFQGNWPPQSIAIDNFDDPIIEYLQQVNLLPQILEIGLDDPEGAASFEIYTFVDSASGSLRFNPMSLPSDENEQLLWRNLLKLCDKFAELSNKPELLEYIKRRKGLR